MVLGDLPSEGLAILKRKFSFHLGGGGKGSLMVESNQASALRVEVVTETLRVLLERGLLLLYPVETFVPEVLTCWWL